MSDQEDVMASKWKSKISMFTKRVNWKVLILTQWLLVQVVGWWWCGDKWAMETSYRVVIPGIGTVAGMLSYHIFASIAMLVVAWGLEYRAMKSQQYFHIEHVYKDDAEPRYGVDGAEVEDDLDAEDLDREKWFAKAGDPIYISIDREDMNVLFNNEKANIKTLSADQIVTILGKYVPSIGPDPDWNDPTLEAPMIHLPPEKVRERIELGHEPAGLSAYCYWVTYNRKAYHASSRGGKAEGFFDCIEICHVPWDREFRMKRRTIPGRGFNVKCPNTERKELAHVNTLTGNLMVFQVTTSHYVRKEATRKIRPTDDELTGIMMKCLTFLYQLRMEDLKQKDELIDTMRSGNVSRDNAVRNAKLDALVNWNVKQYKDDYDRQLSRGQRSVPEQKGSSNGLIALTCVFGGLLAIIVILLLLGVL